MYRKFAVVVLLLVVLAVVSPSVAASPPEKVGGAMTFDTVADGLMKYRQETDPTKRAAWLERLATTGDPRVAVACWEALEHDTTPEVRDVGFRVLAHFATGCDAHRRGDGDIGCKEIGFWWKKNEADLRRRAAQLPR
jgi:hypothetical protein